MGVGHVPHVVADLVLLHRRREVFERLLRVALALYYESEGDEKKCLQHLTTAVEMYKIGHYMWDVADAHLRLLKAKK